MLGAITAVLNFGDEMGRYIGAAWDPTPECGVLLVDGTRMPRGDLSLDADGMTFAQYNERGKLMVPCGLHGKCARVQDPSGRILSEFVLRFTVNKTMVQQLHSPDGCFNVAEVGP